MNLNKTFKSGKYARRTYIEIWKKDPSYFYWLSANLEGDYWYQVVRELEERDRQLELQRRLHSNRNYPTIEVFKQFFQKNLILGFELSDYLTEVYRLVPDNQKAEYFQSLLERNKLTFNL